MLGAPVAIALTNQPPLPKGHIRKLSKTEAEHIVGAQHAVSYSVVGGSTYPWEGSVANTNTGNGNKLTSIPIVGWKARGGLPVQLNLYHNSEGNHNSELGQKWSHSYDIYLGVVIASQTDDGIILRNVTVHWGDDLAYTFTQNIDGSFSAPTGIHDKLVANTSGGTIVSYDLTTKGNVKYHFTNPNTTGWYISTISDLNGNTITVNHNSSDMVTTIVDPTSRTITLSYTSGKVTGISDPLSRSWSISYTSSDLTQITYPTVGGNSYNEQFGYNANHCITSFTDKRGHSAWSATYNSDNSIATETDACSNTSSYSYTSGQTVITDANSHTIKHNYSSGKLSSVEDQATVTDANTYDGSFNKTQVTDRRSHNWNYTYDSAGNVLTKTDPLSHVWTYTDLEIGP